MTCELVSASLKKGGLLSEADSSVVLMAQRVACARGTADEEELAIRAGLLPLSRIYRQELSRFVFMDKETKTASDLEAMIMQQACERPDCAEVGGVAVTSGDLGWRVVAILRDGRMVTPKRIEEIASELRAKYDLAD